MTQLAQDLSALAAGRISVRAIAEAHLDTIARREAVLRAFAWLDPGLVRRRARAVDAARNAGRARPLDGLLIGVKDVLDTADQPSQYGSPIWVRTPAARRCGLRGAGPAGRRGDRRQDRDDRVRHPPSRADPQPGQCGAFARRLLLRLGAGVAAGFFHLGFGTQTAGSIIRPAAFCGAHGFKPELRRAAPGRHEGDEREPRHHRA
jgi:amidase